MIKNLLKNLVANILCLFIAMGIFYFFLLVAATLLVADVVSNLSDALGALSSLIGSSVAQSSASVEEFLSYSFGKIDWNRSIIDIIVQILSTDWLQTTVKGFLQTLDLSTEGFGEDFSSILSVFRDRVVADVAVAAALIVLGVLLADFATGLALRNRTAKRNFKKFLLAHTVVPLVQTLIIAGFIALISVIKLYSLLVIVAVIALFGVCSLTASFIIHGDGKLKLKEVLTAKNVALHAAGGAIILLINVAIDVAVYFINPVFAILLAVPVAIYSFKISDVNTDSYVCSVIENKRAGA